jgi:hypothetical protein
MRTRTSALIQPTPRGSVTRFLAAAIATFALSGSLAIAQTTQATTAPAKPPTTLPPVDASTSKVPEAVLKPSDTPDPSAGWLRITGSTVNVRARPDVNGLSMTRLERDTIVWAIKKENGWWAIAPPPDVFSLIAARFVERTGADRGIVKVKADSILRVRAGSRNVQVNPQETDVQAKIGNGQEVRIVGEVTSGTADDGTPERWLQIAPPEGVAAYISADYAEPISEDAARARGATKPGMTVAANPSAAGDSTVSATDKTAAKPSGDLSASSSSPWNRRLRMIESEIEVESKKATAEQSWARALAELHQIADQHEDADAAGEAQKWVTKLEETSRSAGVTTTVPPSAGTVEASSGTTTIIPVTPAPGTETTPASGTTTTTNTIPMEPSRAASSENAAFDVEGILQPSWRIPAGQFGLRYKLCNPTNPNLVRGYAEFPFDLAVSPTQYIGKYVGVIGDRYMDMDHEVPIYRAKRLTILSPDRPVNRPRDQQ